MNCIMYGVRYVRYWYVAVTYSLHKSEFILGYVQYTNVHYTGVVAVFQHVLGIMYKCNAPYAFGTVF